MGGNGGGANGFPLENWFWEVSHTGTIAAVLESAIQKQTDAFV